MNEPEINHACVYKNYGGPEVLSWQEIAMPQIKHGQVLVRVEALSINPVDWKIMKGQQRAVTGRRIKQHRVFGTDFCGVIVAANSETQLEPYNLSIGSKVVGMVNPLLRGSAARYLALPARDCVAIPMSTNPVQFAGLPAAGISAWRAFNARKPM